MDLRGLEIFLAVCDAGGLTSAARRLSVTQAAVSQHLAKLERDLDVQLVDRSVRPQRITPAGDYLRKRGRQLFGEMDEIRLGVERFRETDIPTLQIGLIESLSASLLPHLVDRLSGQIGKLGITSGITHPMAGELTAGTIDMVVTSEQADTIPGATSIPLVTEPLMLILPKGQPVPRDWDGVAELAGALDFVPYGPKRRMSVLVAHLLDRFGIETHGNIQYDSSAALVERVRSGLGWSATTPLTLFAANALSDDIQIVPFPSNSPVRCINLVWMAERPTGASMLVARTCRDIFAQIVIPAIQSAMPQLHDTVKVAED